MAYVTAEARQQLLDAFATSIDEIGLALAALGDAYEQLDDASADRVEDDLFRPIQAAYGRAQRTHTGFAERHGLQARAFAPGAHGLPSQGVKGFLDTAAEAVVVADHELGRLQDSMMPIEVGDPELRAGLAEVRRLIGDLPERARRFVSLFGR